MPSAWLLRELRTRLLISAFFLDVSTELRSDLRFLTFCSPVILELIMLFVGYVVEGPSRSFTTPLLMSPLVSLMFATSPPGGAVTLTILF